MKKKIKRDNILVLTPSFVEEHYRSCFCKLDVITRGTLPEIKTDIFLDGVLCPIFKMGSVASGLESDWLLDQDDRCQSIKFFLYIFLKNFQKHQYVSFWKKKIANDVCEAFGFEEKENKSAACFVFATTTWSWSRASSVPSHPLLCMSMGSRALNRNRRSKKLEWKKNSFVWMFRIDLKKITKKLQLRQKTVYSSERFRVIAVF